MSKTRVIAVHDHPRGPGRMEFDIDFATGEIDGLVTETAQEAYCRSVLKFIVDHPREPAHFPWQQSYPAPDPLHVPESLALQLQSWGFALEGELAKYPPPEADPLPDGALS